MRAEVRIEFSEIGYLFFLAGFTHLDDRRIIFIGCFVDIEQYRCDVLVLEFLFRLLTQDGGIEKCLENVARTVLGRFEQGLNTGGGTALSSRFVVYDAQAVFL